MTVELTDDMYLALSQYATAQSMRVEALAELIIKAAITPDETQMAITNLCKLEHEQPEPA